MGTRLSKKLEYACVHTTNKGRFKNARVDSQHVSKQNWEELAHEKYDKIKKKLKKTSLKLNTREKKPKKRTTLVTGKRN